jgi:small subunit ribosomal protein S21
LNVLIFQAHAVNLPPNKNTMLSIPVKEGDNIERALKRFKKKFDRTKRMRELRSRREFVKPSVVNREQRKKAVYKNGLNIKND